MVDQFIVPEATRRGGLPRREKCFCFGGSLNLPNLGVRLFQHSLLYQAQYFVKALDHERRVVFVNAHWRLDS